MIRLGLCDIFRDQPIKFTNATAAAIGRMERAEALASPRPGAVSPPGGRAVGEGKQHGGLSACIRRTVAVDWPVTIRVRGPNRPILRVNGRRGLTQTPAPAESAEKLGPAIGARRTGLERDRADDLA
jgi:hypothetical protein